MNQEGGLTNYGEAICFEVDYIVGENQYNLGDI